MVYLSISPWRHFWIPKCNYWCCISWSFLKNVLFILLINLVIYQLSVKKNIVNYKYLKSCATRYLIILKCYIYIEIYVKQIHVSLSSPVIVNISKLVHLSICVIDKVKLLLAVKFEYLNWKQCELKENYPCKINNFYKLLLSCNFTG